MEESVARREAVRVLVAFGGDHAQYMSDTVTHVVSERPWDREFESARTANPHLVFVRPAWLKECARLKRRVDTTLFDFGPK